LVDLFVSGQALSSTYRENKASDAKNVGLLAGKQNKSNSQPEV